MKNRLCKLNVSTGVLVISLGVLSAGQAPAGRITGAEAFTRLTKLSGEWTGTMQTPDGNPATIMYRVTSGGKTVMETLGPGTDHEMVSMYHMDGRNLVMTHYCSAGNQPHMRLTESKSSPDIFVFDFTGGTNLDPSRDMHIHGLVLRIISDDSLEAEWTGYKDGKKADVLRFFVTRKK